MIASEESPYCGQAGRVLRVFWRGRVPWVVVRLRAGGVTAVPCIWTDLPLPVTEQSSSPRGGPAALLSPATLRDLVRFFCDRRGKPNGKKH